MNRNASPSANGWLFQVSAGVYLFLKNIKINKSIKIEGQKEDIEIISAYGNKYVQVKSILNVNERSSVYSHYSKALKSLKDADESECELVYFSNIKNPFNVNDANFYDYGTSFTFSDLTKDAQKKIKNILGEKFNYSKLTIMIVNSFGTDESKKKFVIDEIQSFLSKVDGSTSKANQIYESLFTKFFYNAANKCVKINKESFIHCILLPYLNQTIIEDDFVKLIDIDYYDEINDKYERYLYQNEFNYELYTKINSLYREYKQNHNKSNVFDYINNEFCNFSDVVSNSFDINIRYGLIKLLMYRVIKKSSLLLKIKEESGL